MAETPQRNEFDCYTTWGFRENPFQPSPLHADSRGERLLVGRDVELGNVKTRLHRHGKVTCIEGEVGVGKTSLVNIAAFQCLNGFTQGKANQLLIPCRTPFQLQPKEKVDEFCTRVFVEVAQTLLDQAKRVRGLSLDMSNKEALDAWLNSPRISNIEVGLHAYVEVTRKAELNEGEGFNAHGFQELVQRWLKEIFPAHGSGGVVCVIDNLELLETGYKARKVLERLRDRLFNVEGIRWVFCGANGIVSSVIASPRLSGYLIRPILDVNSLNGDQVPEILRRRAVEFAIESGKEYLPITEDDLQRLYLIINFNLRDLLAHADDYCMYIWDHRLFPKTDEDKRKRFEVWLTKQTKEQYYDLRKRIAADAWEMLDTAMCEKLKGRFGPGDFNYFKSNSYVGIEYKTFMRHMRKFEELGLISRSIEGGDEDEVKRTVFTVSSKGAMVQYARFMANETKTMASPWLRRVATRAG
jgi:hypothetical protein